MAYETTAKCDDCGETRFGLMHTMDHPNYEDPVDILFICTECEVKLEEKTK